jgi:hypothetical protein
MTQPPGGERTAPEAGLTPADVRRIQNAANRYRVVIYVVGSRAMGQAVLHPLSDWDYIVHGSNSRIRNKLKKSLPRGLGGGDLGGYHPSGIDLMHMDNPQAPGFNPLRPDDHHVIFVPQGG